MLAVAGPARQTRPRFLDVPWPDDHPRFVAIDRLLHPDHPARWIHQAVGQLDLGPLSLSYLGRGSDAYPPAPLLAFVLHMLLQGKTSPAQWARDARRNDEARWLLRGLCPGRSQFYTFRTRLAPFLDSWHRDILAAARQDGLLCADTLSLDGTLVASYASRHRILTGHSVSRRLEQLRCWVGSDELRQGGPALWACVWLSGLVWAQQMPQECLTQPWRWHKPRPYWLARTARGRKQQLARYEHAWQRLCQQQQQQAERPPGKRTPLEGLKISVSDPEAALGLDKERVYRPLFNVQLVQSTEVPLTLAFEVVASSSDQGQLRPMVEQTEKQTGQKVDAVLVDEGYLNIPDLTWCERRGSEVYAPAKKGRSRRPPARVR
jgi:transposase